MSRYETRDERAELEADFDSLPDESAAEAASSKLSTVISVRFNGDELAAVERAASEAGLPLSKFIRQAALDVSSPFDIRAASEQADRVAAQMRELVEMLHGKQGAA